MNLAVCHAKAQGEISRKKGSEDLNKIFLSGHLTKDPEVRYTNSGKAVASFSIDVNRFARKGEKPETDFFNLEAWEKTAEFIGRYFSKGSKILIVGRLMNNIYEKDGVKHYSEKIVVEKLNLSVARRRKNQMSRRTNGTARPSMMTICRSEE